MKNFEKIGEFNPQPVLQELIKSPFWNWLNLRRNDPSLKHYTTDDIVLRFQSVLYDSNYQTFYDGLKCEDYFTQRYHPKVMNAVYDWFPIQFLGRVLVANLRPRTEIGFHIDEGNYAARHDRYHMVVTSNDKVSFMAGDESCHMMPGEIWWFDNKTLHSVKNDSDENRYHIIVDVWK